MILHWSCGNISWDQRQPAVKTAQGIFGLFRDRHFVQSYLKVKHPQMHAHKLPSENGQTNFDARTIDMTRKTIKQESHMLAISLHLPRCIKLHQCGWLRFGKRLKCARGQRHCVICWLPPRTARIRAEGLDEGWEVGTGKQNSRVIKSTHERKQCTYLTDITQTLTFSMHANSRWSLFSDRIRLRIK